MRLKFMRKRRKRMAFLQEIKKAVLSKNKLRRSRMEIQTDADKVFNFIKERGSVTIEETLERVKIDTNMLRKWVSLLENRGLVIMEYPLLKPPVLKLLKTPNIRNSRLAHYDKKRVLPINGG